MELAAEQSTDAESQIPLEGDFWAAEAPARRRRGELTVRAQTDALLDTIDLVDMRAVTMTMFPNGETHWTQSGDPEDVVADFSPITVHGVLDAGRDVTLVDAMGTAGVASQSFRVRYVLDGAHVDGHDERFSAVRFQLDDPRWWTHLEDGMTAQGGTVGSLSISRDGQSVWFVFELTEPMTLRECDSLVTSPALTLARLASGMDLDIGPTQLRVGPATSPWISVLTKRRSSEPIRRRKQPTEVLLPSSVLGIDNFASWIDLSVAFDGLPAVVANPPKGVAIQAEALTMASVAEGLHRRLFSGTGNMTYRARLEQLEQAAVEVVPQVTAGFTNLPWAPSVVKTRNLLAHQLDDDKREMLEKIDAMTLVAWSVPWVLRIVLLRRAGLDTETISARLADFNAFQYYRANVASIQSKYQH
ncbi:HEPN domain-containing protein [Rhodococcus jostii]|nr:HEPN domain-containing protein [Rhodococcus jostii]